MEHVPERQIRPDGYGQSDYTFRLPNMRIPKPIMPGIRGWKTSDGWMVLRLHYSADPERATDEWITQQLVGYRGGKLGRDWMREMEVDFCIGPDTRVLTSDLRWVKASEVEEGDVLAGFDEDNSPEPRRWRYAEVERARVVRLPAYWLTFSDGTRVLSSENHRWLNGYGQKWRFVTTKNLRTSKQYPSGSKIIKFADPWEPRDDAFTGYLAASYDGEGSLAQRTGFSKTTGVQQGGVTVSFGQNENAMLDRFLKCLDELGFAYADRVAREYSGVRHHHVTVTQRAEVLRLLGQVRPSRLLDKLDLNSWGRITAVDGVELVSKKYAGEQELVALTTSTGTFIAEGLASHNSSYAGEPVYAGFDAVRSVLPTNYNPHLPLWRGWDFGYRHPAVVWAQLWEDDTLCILHEMYPTLNRDAMAGISTPDLIRMVIEQTESLFPHAGKEATGIVEDFVDPAGNQTKETSDFSSIEHMHQFGIDPEWSVVGRKNRINYLRSYIEVPGKLRVNPHCGLTIKALSAAYRYPEERGGQVDRDMPDLSKRVQEEPYVHIMDALEYVAACRLEIAFDPSSLRTIEEERQDVGTLAEMYLRYSGHNDRTDRSASGGGEPGAESYETGVSELLGLEDIADLTAALAEW